MWIHDIGTAHIIICFSFLAPFFVIRLLSILISQRYDHLVERSFELEGTAIEFRHLGTRIATYVKSFRKRIGAYMHPGHVNSVHFLTVNVKLSASAELSGLYELEFQLCRTLRQFR